MALGSAESTTLEESTSNSTLTMRSTSTLRVNTALSRSSSELLPTISWVMNSKNQVVPLQAR
ncbi:hypothetical protein Mrose_01924 [Calidithermus roseus]|uniref:Uncharacterized protein n=1 Tax=Calidithermus roseus TaxID=1644118 RepID=A0A399ESX5_9DEIN|nr:hypothetical protein Mrose_01924 [Calidithermus roseus]